MSSTSTDKSRLPSVAVASMVNTRVKNRSKQASLDHVSAVTAQASKDIQQQTIQLSASKARSIADKIYRALKELQDKDPATLLKFYHKVKNNKALYPRHGHRNMPYYYDALRVTLAQSGDMETHLGYAEDASGDHKDEDQSKEMPKGYLTDMAMALVEIAVYIPKLMFDFQKATERYTFSTERSHLNCIQALLLAYVYGYAIETRIASNQLPGEP